MLASYIVVISLDLGLFPVTQVPKDAATCLRTANLLDLNGGRLDENGSCLKVDCVELITRCHPFSTTTIKPSGDNIADRRQATNASRQHMLPEGNIMCGQAQMQCVETIARAV
jgi:hypothetical protein